MHKPIRSYLRSATLIGAASALTVAGLALAQGGSGTSGSKSGAPRPRVLSFNTEGPAGPRQNLTYAEFHVIDHGQAKVVRLDAGKVVSTSDTSITIGENDGNQVTIPVDSGTQVLAGPGKDIKVTDLKQGERVNVSHTDGGAADTIMVPPKPGDLPKLGALPKPGDLPKGAILRKGPATVRVFGGRAGNRAFKSGAPPVGAGFTIVGPPPRKGR